MAEFQKKVKGSSKAFVDYLIAHQKSLGVAVSVDNSYAYQVNDVDIDIMMFEKYSFTGGNRIAMSVTCIGYSEEFDVLALVAGASNALFAKVNLYGEDAFLQKFVECVNDFEKLSNG